jgi:hypothetical protein
MNTNNGWLDIATAPKDGTPVLLFARHVDAKASTRVVGAFNPDYGWIAQSYRGQSVARLVPSLWADLLPFPGAHPIPASTVADEGAKDERQAFEAWAKKKKMPLARIGQQYDDFWVDHAWNGWQARASGAAPAAGDARALEFVREVALQKPEKPDHWSSCGQCASNISHASDLLDEIAASQQGGE